MKTKIVLLEDRYENHDPERKIFSGSEYEVVEVPDLSDTPAVAGVCKDADALLVNLYKADRKFISNLEKCRVISRYGIGYDSIDITAASEKGIKVTNVPGACSEEVAEHIIALLFSCSRNIPLRDRKIRKGNWNIKGSVPVYRIAGKKIGIIGYGRTGQALHRRLCSLGFEEIAVFDHHSVQKEKLLLSNSVNSRNAFFKSFEYIIGSCDFISLNIPLDNSTRHIIGEKEFSLMKNTGIIINTSRGAVIDTEAMINALESKSIAGAGIDVFETEPHPEDSRLNKLDNVVLTDHNAWYSIESQADLQHKCAEAAKAVLSGNDCSSIVNLNIL